MNNFFELAFEVQDALRFSYPIVALESTVISHGLPYPDNLSTIQSMQEIIRSFGVIPATVGVIEGKIKIGLSDEEIAFFAKNKTEVMKVNRADLSFCLAQKKLGATTVSATAFCAQKAGIKIFATGGIGGVHRGAEQTFDISSDLSELSQTPILVVCAGAKSILDIPKTLEYLETHSVPVVGYKTNRFPLFYSLESPFLLKQRVNSINEAADLLRLHFALQSSSIILAQPIEAKDSLNAHEIEQAIVQAISECQKAKKNDKDVTPFILARLTELTGGQTLSANKSLLINNAKLAAEISLALSR